jgi:hypothetical protein
MNELGGTVLEGENLSQNKPVLEAYLGDFIAARRTQVICRWST